MIENENKMPLLGDEFPKLSVQTTHGPLNLSENMQGK